MLRLAVLSLILLPALAPAQTPEIVEAIDMKLKATRFVRSLEKPNGGFASGPKDKEVTLKATSAAVRALKYLTGKKATEAIPTPKATTAYVLSCYDAATGGFGDKPGAKPDLYTSAVGIMAAVELEIPREKIAKCMEYLKANVQSFEDARIAAAAVEAWGVKECPFDFKPWLKIEDPARASATSMLDGGARSLASQAAMHLRLGDPLKTTAKSESLVADLGSGQRKDGGWGRAETKESDLETTYRVMRLYMLLKTQPKDVPKVRAFIASCRNADGGFGVKPGAASTAAGTYFAIIITTWLPQP